MFTVSTMNCEFRINSSLKIKSAKKSVDNKQNKPFFRYETIIWSDKIRIKIMLSVLQIVFVIKICWHAIFAPALLFQILITRFASASIRNHRGRRSFLAVLPQQLRVAKTHAPVRFLFASLLQQCWTDTFTSAIASDARISIPFNASILLNVMFRVWNLFFIKWIQCADHNKLPVVASRQDAIALPLRFLPLELHTNRRNNSIFAVINCLVLLLMHCICALSAIAERNKSVWTVSIRCCRSSDHSATEFAISRGEEWTRCCCRRCFSTVKCSEV